MLLCAFVALAAIAEVRASASRLADPVNAFMLCGGAGNGTDIEHDCESCCLTSPVTLPISRTGFDIVRYPAATAYLPSMRQARDAENNRRPWSRGPPARS